MTVRVLILPGLLDSGPDHWQSRWEQRFSGLKRVKQSDWQTPSCADWVQKLHKEVTKNNRPVALVAHSLACTLIALWAQEYPEAAKRVRGALLVAPSDTEAESYPSGTQGFTPMPLNPLPFQSITVASTDDPYVTLERARVFSEAWGSTKLQILDSAGHINAQSGLGHWPLGISLLFDLTGDQQFHTAAGH
ncbi:alpha/beta hydrolase [Pseudomonas sp. WS 5071]|uniref:RBBP9/YdeN family alpha/beta hydrolase n=1 Tax=Pseudomonas sp. WS 5071 TaxID=2717479 RepID=UPI0014733603|nr:alpha/beta hydrolase [Pseudomonas sp. WS 5071]NMY73116.1 alpha/beta hydrolase [Pseudomonas sp. WS 5071]